jgi:hypothetical protein
MKALDGVERVDRFGQSEGIGASIKSYNVEGPVSAILNLPTAFTGNRATTRVARHRPQVGTAIAFPDSRVSLFTMARSVQTGRSEQLSDCRSLDELTGGRFTVTIIRGLSGAEASVGVTNS